MKAGKGVPSICSARLIQYEWYLGCQVLWMDEVDRRAVQAEWEHLPSDAAGNPLLLPSTTPLTVACCVTIADKLTCRFLNCRL